MLTTDEGYHPISSPRALGSGELLKVENISKLYTCSLIYKGTLNYQCLRYQELTVPENQLKMDELTAITNFLLLIQYRAQNPAEKARQNIH